MNYSEIIETEPNLIWACGTKGESGYVRSSDLNGNMPKNPEEAIKITQENEGKSSEIPLYDKDGKTVIGSFRISVTHGTGLKAEDIK